MRVRSWLWLTAVTVTASLLSAIWLAQSEADAPLSRSGLLRGTHFGWPIGAPSAGVAASEAPGGSHP